MKLCVVDFAATIETLIEVSNVYELLNRQKVTKKVLTDYLRARKGRFDPKGDKASLIRSVIEMWEGMMGVADEKEKKDMLKFSSVLGFPGLYVSTGNGPIGPVQVCVPLIVTLYPVFRT